jgi:iron complex transport system permease protein
VGLARTPVAAGGLGLTALLIAGLWALMVGEPFFNPVHLWHLLWGGSTVDRVLAWQARLPRFVLGALAGALLATSGALVQDAMRNALAGPELLGVSSGSALVMAVIIVLDVPVAAAWQPWLALAGGILGGGTVIALSWTARSPAQVVLIGASVSALLDGAITAVISLGQQSTVTLLYQYLVGDLADRTWSQVLVVLPWIAILAVAWVLAPQLNLLRLGDEPATGLGLKTAAVRFAVLGLAVAAVGPVIAVCGPISYVALLSPHAARRILGTHDARRVLPIAAIIGAVLLTAADVLAQVLLDPIEMPAGVFTVLLGGPVLLLLLSSGLERSRG